MVLTLFRIPVMPCQNRARLPHSVAEIIVKVAEIHGDRMHSIGGSSKFCDHARVKNHADAFKALLAEDAAEYAEELAQICAGQTVTSLLEDSP